LSPPAIDAFSKLTGEFTSLEEPSDDSNASSVTTAETLTSDRLFLFISDGQAARHWYAVTGIQLLVTGSCPSLVYV
jgi:hypothetical protein